jgi:hypothetical protein
MAFLLQVSANILNWPRMCACCGEVADTLFRAAASHTKGKRVQHTTTKWWEVPWCGRCAEHSRWFSLSQNVLTFGLVAGGAAILFAAVSEANRIIAIVIGVLLFASTTWAFRAATGRARLLTRTSCAATMVPVRYTDWHGTFHTFTFESRGYLEAFITANNRKTMSDVREV